MSVSMSAGSSSKKRPRSGWRQVEVADDALRFASVGGFLSLEEADEDGSGLIRWDGSASGGEAAAQERPAELKRPAKRKKKKVTVTQPVEGTLAQGCAAAAPPAMVAPASSAEVPEGVRAIVTSAWAPFGLHPHLLDRIAQQGFAEPTPIQAACLPPALHGRRDIVGAAETGSGKTLAFGLPIMQRLIEQREAGEPQRGLFALVITPTRELALQVSAHFRALLPPPFRVVALVGGMAVVKQKRLLQARPEIVVATPGRLWELLSSDAQPHLRSLDELRFFVLDEVDRMVDAGHFRELGNILQLLQTSPVAVEDGSGGDGGGGGGEVGTSGAVRQTFLFSATLMLPPAAKEANAKKLKAHKPATHGSTMERLLRMVVFQSRLKVVDLSRAQLVAAKLEQAVVTCMANEKDAYLHLLLRQRPGRAIVFCNAISCLRRLRALLELLGRRVIALQGDMQQRARLKAVDRFVSQPQCVLLATDVAARGLDFPAVDYVVHFQPPLGPKVVDPTRRTVPTRPSQPLRAGRWRGAPDSLPARSLRKLRLPRSSETYVHRSGRTARATASGLSICLVEPAEQRAYRKLCLELGEADGLAELPLDTRQLPRHRELTSLAAQLDSVAHKEKRSKAHKQWRQKLTQEMELPTDSEDEEGSEDEGAAASRSRREQIEEREQAQKRAKLAELLRKLDRGWR